MTNLHTFDVLILIILAFTIVRGWIKGLAWQIASIASIIVSYIVAAQFGEQLAVKLNIVVPLAQVILYLVTSLVIWLVFRQIRHSIEKMKLRDFDRQMGALSGLAKGLALSGVLTTFAVSLSGEDTRRSILSSRSGHLIGRMMVQADPFMPTGVRDFLAQHLERLDQELEQGNWATYPRPRSQPLDRGYFSPSVPTDSNSYDPNYDPGFAPDYRPANRPDYRPSNGVGIEPNRSRFDRNAGFDSQEIRAERRF